MEESPAALRQATGAVEHAISITHGQPRTMKDALDTMYNTHILRRAPSDLLAQCSCNRHNRSHARRMPWQSRIQETVRSIELNKFRIQRSTRTEMKSVRRGSFHHMFNWRSSYSTYCSVLLALLTARARLRFRLRATHDYVLLRTTTAGTQAPRNATGCTQ